MSDNSASPRTRRVAQGSQVVAWLREHTASLLSAAQNSAVFGWVHIACKKSTAWRHAEGREATAAWVSQFLSTSLIASYFRAAVMHSDIAFGGSRSAAFVEKSRRFATRSFLYRWLTAEPESKVIIIDLRKTVAIGPWIVLFGRTIEWLLPATVSSTLFRVGRRVKRSLNARPVQIASTALGLVAAITIANAATGTDTSSVSLVVGACLALIALLGSRVTWSLTELRETRGYQALVAAFEPPEPPDASDEAQNDTAETETDGDVRPDAEWSSDNTSE